MAADRLGFIGLGNMGLPMARNAAAAGFDLRVFDISASAMSAARAAGLTVAASAAEAARDARFVLTMLPAGQNVRSVYCGEEGLFKTVNDGALLIDSSTIDVETARALHQGARARGVSMLDAPVSGGAAGATAGTLTFMVGGDRVVFEAAERLLQSMGNNIIHAGSAGNGQAAKICNNMILGISMIAVSEAFALAKGLGLDPQTLFDISSMASGQCWSLTSYCPEPGPVPSSPANNDYRPGFTTNMMLKDLRLSQHAAQSTQTLTSLGAEAYQLYNMFAQQGNGDKDFSAIITMIKERQGSD